MAPISILSPVDPIRDISAISTFVAFGATNFIYFVSYAYTLLAVPNNTFAVFLSDSPSIIELFPNLNSPSDTFFQSLLLSLIYISYSDIGLYVVSPFTALTNLFNENLDTASDDLVYFRPEIFLLPCRSITIYGSSSMFIPSCL